MHEFSLCESILTTALREFEKLSPRPPALMRVRVVMGAMHQVVPDYLQSAWGMLSRDTDAAGATLDLEMTPVTASCQECGWSGGIEPPAFVCGECGGFSVKVIGGNEFFIKTMEVAEHEDA